MISPDRLAALIAGWTHETEVAEANQRADEYANTCRDTAEALRELRQLLDAGYIVTRADPELPAVQVPYASQPDAHKFGGKTCCRNFSWISSAGIADKETDGVWNICQGGAYVARKIKFCPYCGVRLSAGISPEVEK